MMDKIVFISTPMSGLPDSRIRENLGKAKDEYLRRFDLDPEDVYFKDNFEPEDDNDGEYRGMYPPLYFLGRAMIKMAHSDEVFFFGEWKEARGCQIEHEVCVKYGIPYVEA